MLSDLAIISLQVVGLYLSVDFIAGTLHWAEDTLGTPTSPIWGPAFVAPNVIHHDDPAAMNRIPWLLNNLPLYVLGIVLLVLAWATGNLGWKMWLFVAIGIFSQQAHRWSHRPRKALPRVVLTLQRLQVLQSGKMHWKHHRGDHATHFCVVTPWLNPILDRFGVWRGLERFLVPIFGAPRRPDLAHHAWYRDRAAWA